MEGILKGPMGESSLSGRDARSANTPPRVLRDELPRDNAYFLPESPIRLPESSAKG